MFKLSSANLKATVLSRGATLSGLWFAGRNHSLVLGSPDPLSYIDDVQYFGAIVGPVANRVTDATVEIGATTWRMPANEGGTCLHSGPTGLHARHWELTDQSESHVAMTCSLAHGECGLPGHREITARYELRNDSTLRLELAARSDRATVMNLAHHPYWNLDGNDTIAAHDLAVRATHYLPVDTRTLPIGDIRDVAGSACDFRTARAVPTDSLLDFNLCLATVQRNEPQEAARLLTTTGCSLTIRTTEPGLQVYNGFGLTPTASPLHDGRILRPCAGLALEPQSWPDVPRNAHFPSILLHPDTPYWQITDYMIAG